MPVPGPTSSPQPEHHGAALAARSAPTAAWRSSTALAAEPALAGYHHLPSVRGGLLTRLGRYGEAASELRRAASLTKNIPERTVLLLRAAKCDARA